MTFISTVIARDGVAIIADSLVTAMHRIIEEEDFRDLLKKKSQETKSKKVTLKPEEIGKLIKTKPSHTKDYENKLFKYDDYTAITTSGAAIINGKRIEEIIFSIIEKNKKDRSYKRKKVETKVNDFCEYLTLEVKKHLKQESFVPSVKFILTHFDKKTNKTTVYRINILFSSKDKLKNEGSKYVESNKTQDFEKVVCEGQNRISESILLGDLLPIYRAIPKIVEKVTADFKIEKKKIPKNYIEKLRKDEDIITRDLLQGVSLFRLKGLSLQQAVDLACLLMNIEIDFQKYTENIPVVGGVIKLAKIDKDGFEFLSGHKITKPVSV